MIKVIMNKMSFKNVRRNDQHMRSDNGSLMQQGETLIQMIVDHLGCFGGLTTHVSRAIGKIFRIRIQSSNSVVNLFVEEVTDVLDYSNDYLVDQLE